MDLFTEKAASVLGAHVGGWKGEWKAQAESSHPRMTSLCYHPCSGSQVHTYLNEYPSVEVNMKNRDSRLDDDL